MATKTVSRTINDKEVNIALLGALDGIKITTQLSKVVFPTLAALKGDGVSKSDLDFKALIISALDSLEEVDLTEIIKKLFKEATVDSGEGAFPINPDVYFSGNYGELIDFLAFALEANFGSFFEAKFLKDMSTPTRQKSKR